jgi:hypothetical protein
MASKLLSLHRGSAQHLVPGKRKAELLTRGVLVALISGLLELVPVP